MLEEGLYCKILDKRGDSICVLRVFNDQSHNLKIISQEFRTGELKVVELHSPCEVENLYKFLKEYFEEEELGYNDG